MDGLIDIEFSQSFIDYAERSSSTLPESDLFSIKYQSKPQSLIDNPHEIGTIWSTPSTIHASFPSRSSPSNPHVFTSIPSSSSSSSSPNPDLLLLLSNSSNCPTCNISLLPPSNQFTLKQVRSNQVHETPKVPSQEELGKKQREFFNEGLGGFNPFKMPNSTREKGDGDTEMKRVDERGSEVKRSGKVTEAEVEDFGSFSFSPNPNEPGLGTKMNKDDTEMEEVVDNNIETPSNSLMLPSKPKPKPPRSPSLPSNSTPLALPALPRPIPFRPQFSSKIPASSSAKPSPILPSYNKQDSISSEDSVSSSDEEFEDVSIPTPSIPKPPLNPSKPIPSFLPPTTTTNQPQKPPSSSRPLPPTSSSLRSIIHPPSSPALQPPKPPPSSNLPNPILPSSRPPSTTIKTRKPSLSADQASSDSSSSSSSSSGSDSDSDPNNLEASINASLGGGQRGTGKRGVGIKAKAAMSSGGKGQRLIPTPTTTTGAGMGMGGNGVGGQGQGQGQGRPTISRKGLAPPPSANQNQNQNQVGGGETKLNSRQGTTLSAYDQQRLAQYGHVRASSAGGVGGAVVAMDLGEESEEEEEEESGSESD